MPDVLQGFGVGEFDERVYRTLLTTPSLTLADLGRILGHRSRISAALQRLEDAGMVSRAPGEPRRYLPTPPQVALQALAVRRDAELRQQQEELRALQLTAAALLDGEFARGHTDHGVELMEVISGVEAVTTRYEQIQRAAREQVRTFVAPPWTFSQFTANPVQPQRLAEGIRYRAVYARVALERPGIDVVLREQQLGEDTRVVDELPCKLVIADESLALLPMHLDGPGTAGSLLVHSPALLRVLVALFERTWEAATPLGTSADGRPAELSAEEERVLAMLGAGLGDDAIARQLGVSRITVYRRIAAIMNRLGSKTRFEAGAQAVRRGWFAG